MTAKKFAEKYAGCRAIVEGRPKSSEYYGQFNGTIGRVIGHSINLVHIEVDTDRSQYNWGGLILTACPNPIGFRSYRFAPAYLRILDPLPLLPDDCDTCGAKGIELCRENCPNR